MKNLLKTYCASFFAILLFCTWAVAAPKPRTFGEVYNSSEVTTIAFSPDGRLLADGRFYETDAKTGKDFPGPVRIWNFRSGKLLHVLRHPGMAQSVAFSPDGKLLAVGIEMGFGLSKGDASKATHLPPYKVRFSFGMPGHGSSLVFFKCRKLM